MLHYYEKNNLYDPYFKELHPFFGAVNSKWTWACCKNVHCMLEQSESADQLNSINTACKYCNCKQPKLIFS